jgi:hypothetical protein
MERRHKTQRQPYGARGYSIPVPPQGYQVASDWIASGPDGETLIFQKFGKLTARNLLYMQSELIALEEELHRLDADITRSDDIELKDAAWSWEALRGMEESGNTIARRQMELMVTLRTKLKVYREFMATCATRALTYFKADEALLLQAKVSLLSKVDRRVLDVCRIWFNGGELEKDGTKPHPVLGGQAKDFLDDDLDLVALSSPADINPLSRLLQKRWPAKVSLTEPEP